MAETNAIDVISLTKKYCGYVALNNVSFAIKKGCVAGLIGPNGAGKSSILKILAGLISGTSGDVLINGISVADETAKAKKHISFMPENNPLPDHMRVGEYLRFRAELKGISAKKIRSAAEKVMRQCDLYYEARYKMIKTLSKGYRQRVGIADAMIGDNEIVILDEPTIGLDPTQILGVRKIIDLNRGSRTILISSHILSELETVCDSFVIINRGDIVACGTLEQLIKSIGDKNLLQASIIGDAEKVRQLFSDVCAEIFSFEVSAVSQVCNVKFSASKNERRALLAKLSSDYELEIKKFGDVETSLEDIFLTSTRRCRDQDIAD